MTTESCIGLPLTSRTGSPRHRLVQKSEGKREEGQNRRTCWHESQTLPSVAQSYHEILSIYSLVKVRDGNRVLEPKFTDRRLSVRHDETISIRSVVAADDVA